MHLWKDHMSFRSQGWQAHHSVSTSPVIIDFRLSQVILGTAFDFPIQLNEAIPEVADFSPHFQKQAATHFTYLSKYWWNQALPAYPKSTSLQIPVATGMSCRSRRRTRGQAAHFEAETMLPCYNFAVGIYGWILCYATSFFFDPPRKKWCKRWLIVTRKFDVALDLPHKMMG